MWKYVVLPLYTYEELGVLIGWNVKDDSDEPEINWGSSANYNKTGEEEKVWDRTWVVPVQ